MLDITNPVFSNEDAARAYIESMRWPDGTVCPSCNLKKRVSCVSEKTMKAKGWYYCGRCRKRFTVRVGTVYERSHIPLHKWLLATQLMCSSKNGMSAHQLHRMLDISYKAAWFMGHRIRESMTEHDPDPIGGIDKTVEIDETYYGKKEHVDYKRTSGQQFLKRRPHKLNNRPVFALVERGGNVRPFYVDGMNKEKIDQIIDKNVHTGSNIMTDESRFYGTVRDRFTSHETVRHARGEFVRGPVHTNTIEGFFGLFKRSMRSTYQHCGEWHLHRYLNEFSFRYNTRFIDDKERAVRALRGSIGKRLTYCKKGDKSSASVDSLWEFNHE